MYFQFPSRRSLLWVPLCMLMLVGGLLTGCGSIQVSTDAKPSGDSAEPQTQQSGGQQSSENGGEDGLKPFSEVVPDTARTDEGLITTHRADDNLPCR